MKNIIIALIIALCAPALAAQSKIDKVMKDMEGKKDVKVTYIERRSPKSHKLYRETMILDFSSDSYYEKLAKAFNDERKNAVKASLSNNGMYIFEFEDDNNESRYVLKRNQVSKQWKDKKVKDDTEKKGRRSRKSQDVATLDSYPDLYY